jgi:hypothetical protein
MGGRGAGKGTPGRGRMSIKTWLLLAIGTAAHRFIVRLLAVFVSVGSRLQSLL